jgi:hypothetical protein
LSNSTENNTLLQALSLINNVVSAATSSATLQPETSEGNYTLSSAYNNIRSSSGVPHNNEAVTSVILPTQIGPNGISPDMLPQIDIVSAKMRQQILCGKDINLALLLLPGFVPTASDDEKVKKAPRVANELTFPEFVTAFGVYKRVMCGVYHGRREELDRYESIISRIYMIYGQRAFNEYHRQFSAKSWAFIEQCNVKLDWGSRDRDIYDSITSGRRPNMCGNCQSIEHPTHRCELRQPLLTPRDQQDRRGRAVAFNGDKPICNNFNNNGCTYKTCYRAHVCHGCLGNHPIKDCPERAAAQGRYKQSTTPPRPVPAAAPTRRAHAPPKSA